jgi:hypothetical protein
MKNKSYFIVFVLFTSVTFFFGSCNFLNPIKGNGKIVKVDQELKSEFTSVEIEGVYTLHLSQGTTPQLSIESDENLIEFIDTKVKNHKLIIKNKKKISSSKDINIYLTINSITKLEASGAVLVRSDGKINFDTFTLVLNGASNVLMELNCFAFNAECNGSSTLKLMGAASDADINVKGAGDIDNQQMVVENMKLTVEGGAKVIVNVLKKLDVKVMGAAEVEYLGEPEVHKEISGAGSVNKIF